jgi:micrococcal nuclease
MVRSPLSTTRRDDPVAPLRGVCGILCYMKRFVLVVVIGLCIGLSGLYSQIRFEAAIARVVDGDTVVLRVGDVDYRARLHGIDAPENRQPWGAEATRMLQSLLDGHDSLLVEVPDVDRYGRLIVRLYADGLYVNRELVALGAAWHYTQFDSSEELAAAEREARSRGLGLWSQSDPVAPWEWRRR